MYKYIPQKKRSSLRIKLGVSFYTTLRYFLWIKNNSLFAKLSDSKKYIVKKEFLYTACSDSSDLYRNLSRDDSALQDGKVDNLFVAIKYINGIILEPGKIFSYWKLLGRPTKAKGYKKGMMLVNGRPVSKTAGGLCALSNLIYWITLHTNLTVIERFRHSYDVFPDSNRTRPFGSGATCVYNYRDLMIRNDTDNVYRLELKIENNKLYAAWKTERPQVEQYTVFQKDHYITQEAAGVFVRHNTIYRKRVDVEALAAGLKAQGESTGADEAGSASFDGARLSDASHEEFITENHALMMYRPFIEGDGKFSSATIQAAGGAGNTEECTRVGDAYE